MRYTPRDALADWQLLELATDSRRIVNKEIGRAGFEDLSDILGQLRLLRAAGCPPDLQRGNPLIEKVGTYVVDAWKLTVTVYVLKCKPGLWRLYFIPNAAKHQVVFLYATQDKKAGRRDPEDFKTCKRRLDRLANHGYRVEVLKLPGL